MEWRPEASWCSKLKVNLFSLFYHSPVSPGELFRNFLRYRLNRQQLLECGFPLAVRGRPGRAQIGGCGAFCTSPDPESQVCRCGKRFSMLDEDWYVAEGGCRYHPGKRARGGTAVGLYECCGGASFYEGCARSDYHVSSLHRCRGVEFKRTGATGAAGFTQVYALDTEMCFTTEGMEIVKVSLVWVLGGVLYTSLVRPRHPVLDYNTAFSGVSDRDLAGVRTTVEDAQAEILKYVDRNAVLVGHSLQNDLLGLHLIHERVVDTSVVFPHENGPPYRNSLKSLAARFLGKSIQSPEEGHDSVEDARTCLELMLLRIHADACIPNNTSDS